MPSTPVGGESVDGAFAGGEPLSLRNNLVASLGDAACFSLMVGMGETYFSAYILALRGSEIASGLVTAVPLMAGSLLQLATPWAVRVLNSHKRWVVLTAVFQAISLLLLPLAALCGDWSVLVAFTAVMLYWGAGLASGPAWNTWIEGVVPARLRTRFFSRRVRFGQASILLGFILGGFTLQHGKATGQTLTWFTIVFGVAAACRFASAWLLNRQTECPTRKVVERRVSIRQLFRGHAATGSGRLLVYLFAVQIGVYIAGPYFAPFMLSHMEMTYRDFALLIGLTYLGKVLALPMWGHLAHRAGPRRLLWIGGVSIVPIAGMWMLSRAYWYLAILQVLGGVTWAAYELALVLMFFESIPRAERTSILTVYNLGNSAAQVVGALLGALFLRYFGRSYEVYLWLFVASSVARGLTTVLLPRIPDPRRASAAEPELTKAEPTGIGLAAAVRSSDASDPREFRVPSAPIAAPLVAPVLATESQAS